MSSMTPETRDKNDTKLLLTIGGLVAAAAIGIAVVAGWQSSGEAERAERPRPRPAVAQKTETFPAVREVPTAPEPKTEPTVMTASHEKIPGSTIDAELEVDLSESITIDLSADLSAEGSAAYARREFELAAMYFDAQVAKKPESAWGHYMLGLSQWKNGELDRAADTMRRATELNDQSIKSFINLARIENDRSEPGEALDAAEAALTLDEMNPTALFLKGRSLYNMGRTDEAVDALEASLSIDVDNGYVHNLRGLIEIERGQGELAVVSLQRAAELQPNVAFIFNNLGMAHELSDDLVAASVAYARAVEIDSGYAKAEVNLARLAPRLPAEETEAVDVIADSVESEEAESTVEETSATETTSAAGVSR